MNLYNQPLYNANISLTQVFKKIRYTQYKYIHGIIVL